MIVEVTDIKGIGRKSGQEFLVLELSAKDCESSRFPAMFMVDGEAIRRVQSWPYRGDSLDISFRTDTDTLEAHHPIITITAYRPLAVI